MFEQLLFEYIRSNFKVEGFNFTFGYGEIEPKTKQPYIIQHSLLMDGTQQVLCNDNNFSDGMSFTQWNIYTSSQSSADFINQELFKFVMDLPSLGGYKIGLVKLNSSRSFIEPSIGLYSSVIAFEINYYK